MFHNFLDLEESTLVLPILDDKPVVVVEESTLVFPMPENEPATPSELTPVVPPNNAPDVHVATPIELPVRATTPELEPEIAPERGSFSNPSEETYILGEKILQPALMPTNEDKQTKIDGRKQAKIMTENVYSRKF